MGPERDDGPEHRGQYSPRWLFGIEFRRSAGIEGRSASDSKAQRDWWIETLSLRLGIPP